MVWVEDSSLLCLMGYAPTRRNKRQRRICISQREMRPNPRVGIESRVVKHAVCVSGCCKCSTGTLAAPVERGFHDKR
jgi:hypothetical protein